MRPEWPSRVLKSLLNSGKSKRLSVLKKRLNDRVSFYVNQYEIDSIYHLNVQIKVFRRLLLILALELSQWG